MSLFAMILWACLIVCLAGTVWRVARWLAPDRSLAVPGLPPAPALGVLLGSLSWRDTIHAAPRVIVTFVRDILLQGHLLQKGSLWRWIMHFCLFAGFSGLLLFHALEAFVSRPLFPGYEPTLDPWQFLRNLFGVLVACGLGIALFRRLFVRDMRRTTRFEDLFTLGLIGLIIASGFFLEAAKMVSPAVFTRMTADYLPAPDEADMAALRAFWAKRHGMVFPETAGDNAAPSPERLEKGRELSETACAPCHSPPRSAFVSAPLSRALAPSSAGRDALLWWTHVLSCLFALAWLPFGKLFHILSTPAGILLRGLDPGQEALRPRPVAPMKRAVGLDACTNCGICSRHCSVLPAFLALGTREILPSEKLLSMRKLAGKAGHITPAALAAFSRGGFICTECMRCTVVCPSRINLQDLWLVSKREASRLGYPELYVRLRNLGPEVWERLAGRGGHPAKTRVRSPSLLDNPDTFAPCAQCSVCTSVCPLFRLPDVPAADLDVSPHQLMNLARMGLADLALSTNFLWNCVTCYKCQEHCPRGIPVADVLFELRNLAHARVEAADMDGLLDDEGARGEHP
ncbi:4Fe-4S dicluster domain-containing protein [Desulfolutivibrio sulfoxidireducens]|uniref:4Fe-4S dicluster domain-containing protein n=1 Tax=Desulfolutivibrio sulfoxidireducens TaxID=2773299 RepID=UPI00159EA62D|nr:4Fe-4S dicluster domain-containing protein [Desulfolutivibrio sulfoxidireducens]